MAAVLVAAVGVADVADGFDDLPPRDAVDNADVDVGGGADPIVPAVAAAAGTGVVDLSSLPSSFDGVEARESLSLPLELVLSGFFGFDVETER